MNGLGHEVAECYLELHEEDKVEISTCPIHQIYYILHQSLHLDYKKLPAEDTLIVIQEQLRSTKKLIKHDYMVFQYYYFVY